MIELILKDIPDPILRENFYRIERFIAENVLLSSDFKFFEVDIPANQDSYAIPHGLTFPPTDLIPLSATGDFNYYFRPDLSDRTNLYVSSKGPVRLRFFAGRFNQATRRSLRNLDIPFVAPAEGGGSTTPTNPPTPVNGHEYRFNTPSSMWIINHNLGFYPSTTVFNNGSSQIDAEVNNIDMNQTRVLFQKPTAGFARLL